MVKLLPIDASGAVALAPESMPDMMKTNCEATAAFYRVVGFEPPWIGYVSVVEGRPVGGGAFKGAPLDGRVEIAYYTLPELEGRGHATATATALIRMARDAMPGIVLTAQTLAEPNASNALLKKLGFVFLRAFRHAEDGDVWEWELAGNI